MAKNGKANGKANNGENNGVGLVPQTHGGTLNGGGTPGNKGGTGPPPSAIRAYCRGSFAARIPILEDIAGGEYKATPRDRIKAMDVLGKYGGVDKLALMPDELPNRDVTPERVQDMWDRLRMIKSIEELEVVMVSAAQKQIGSGPTLLSETEEVYTMRTIVIGAPRCGKTTFADALGTLHGIDVRHTDDLMDMEWSEASLEASGWYDAPGPFIIEGTMAVRALRKWMERNPGKKPCDRIVYLDTPYVELTKGQAGMAKGCKTIYDGISDDLGKHFIEVHRDVDGCRTRVEDLGKVPNWAGD